jgi:hypothetical protein
MRSEWDENSFRAAVHPVRRLVHPKTVAESAERRLMLFMTMNFRPAGLACQRRLENLKATLAGFHA